MTLKELHDAVALLGAEESLEAIDTTAVNNFYNAATKAVLAVNAIRPRKVIAELVHSGSAWTAVSGNNEISTESKATVISFDFSLFNDFLRFRTPPYLPWGASLIEGSDYCFRDNTILELNPALKESLYRVEYDMAMPKYNADMAEERIPLDDDLLAMLPNLVGYYVLLDDNPTMAAHLKNMYDEQYALAMRAKRSYLSTYQNTNNW